MRVSQDLRDGLDIYLKYLENQKTAYQTIIKAVKSILEENKESFQQQIPNLKKLANSQDEQAMEACNVLAICYGDGLGVKRSLPYAISLFQRAAEQGVAYAQYNLGTCYYNAVPGITKDLKRAVELFQLAAAQNYSIAQNMLGLCYYEGSGVNKDLIRAKLMFQVAVNSGNVAAKKNLNAPKILALNISSLELQNAVGFYTKLSKNSDKETARTALSGLGFCYQIGLGVKQNLERAKRFYIQALRKGCVGSLRDLFVCYRQMSIPVMSKIISDILEFDTRLKTPFTHHLHMECERDPSLAYLYEYGSAWHDQDLYQAYERYRTAAKGHMIHTGMHSSICNQERAYVQNKLVKYTPFYKFYSVVHKIFKQEIFQRIFKGMIPSIIIQYAFEEGLKYDFSAVSQKLNELGVDYRDGQGVPKDLERSIEFFQWAVEQGSAKAQLNLGICYEQGLGVKKSLTRALELYQQTLKRKPLKTQNNLAKVKPRSEIAMEERTCIQQKATTTSLYQLYRAVYKSFAQQQEDCPPVIPSLVAEYAHKEI